ncbi:MAG: aromatic ring-hydroxylating dioxygenase subunit alpha [Gammaproteobacteria bacterium]|nr:aromatic ring-hydroxylating dioxygenase subunit alpha [Gammaproteobacteria bacterium]
MYINFWYPIARSEEVTADKPLRVELLGLPFVAFRDEDGTPHVLADTCVHRGGSLSAGWVRGGRAICPYHGWEFSGDGMCQHVPSLVGAKIPARAKVDAYPTADKYGIVFAFLGDLPAEERPPLYDIEEYDDPSWKAQLYVINLNAYYERSMENGLDPIHNQFVHPKQGAPMLAEEKQKEPVPMEDIPWGSKFYLKFGGDKDENTDLADEKHGKKLGSAGSWHQGPNQLVTWIDLTEENSFHQYIFEAPVDDKSTRLFFVNMRNWLMEDKHDDRVEQVTLEVVEEDVAILERLHPVRTPETNTKEILVPGDTAVVRYRDYLKDWDARGWRIDFRTMKDKAGDIAFTIPCPARRESGNWVLDPVPLQPGDPAMVGSARRDSEIKAGAA